MQLIDLNSKTTHVHVNHDKHVIYQKNPRLHSMSAWFFFSFYNTIIVMSGFMIFHNFTRIIRPLLIAHDRALIHDDPFLK
jgi:hypothetical protein